TRAALGAAGVPQPSSTPVRTADAALRVAERIGYPVVVKPSDLALSLGVVIVHTPAELADAFAATSAIRVPELPDYRVRVLLEEYVDGDEISVDTAVCRGETFPLVLARKQVGFAPYAVEVGHHVDHADPLLTDPTLAAVLRDTHAALGLTDGVTHTELKLTVDGPKVIEVNGRLGGDLIPYLGLCSRGIDTGLAAAAVACGERPGVRATRSTVAGVRFCYPETRIRVDSIGFDETALHPATDRYGALVAPGSIAPPPPEGILTGRTAYVTAVADTVKECLAALDAGAAALRIDGTAPGGAVPDGDAAA
ncbi:MAG: ATP-grasp domain-containing protein, partial [Actinocatenispora sp.]